MGCVTPDSNELSEDRRKSATLRNARDHLLLPNLQLFKFNYPKGQYMGKLQK